MSLEEWTKKAKQEYKSPSIENRSWESLEGIQYKPLYTKEDLSKCYFVDSLPGFSDYIRGVKATMYTNKAWTIRQYAGFSTVKESNEFFKKSLKAGMQGISVAFDLATHRGYDSDHPEVIGDVGRAGVAVDSVLDMIDLFSGISLEKTSVSMTMNGAVLPVLAAFIVAGEKQGVLQKDLSGTIQNDILKEFMVRNTYIYPPKVSMRIVSDIIKYTSSHMPKFNSISISGYHMQEAGADASLELAFSLADGEEYVKRALSAGLSIDEFAPRLSFFFGVGMNFFMEIAKLRVSRLLWSQIIEKYSPTNPKSKLLRMHCQTSGWSLVAQDPYNNIVRTTIEAMAAAFGGTQSLHTNSFDEALSLPSEFSSRIARNTQIIMQEETDITKVVDPWGGSFFMEKLSLDLIEKVKSILLEIEEYGGMAEAIENGMPKRRIEEVAARKQAFIDSGAKTVVGLNKYKFDERNIQSGSREQNNEKIGISIDSNRVRQEQVSRLELLRKKRDNNKVKEILGAISSSVKNSSGNLLEMSIEAVRRYATVGEISDAISDVCGRYQSKSFLVSGVYHKMFEKDKNWQNIRKRIEEFNLNFGRNPRILVAKMGQDGHDRGAKVIASAFSDAGFDVDLSAMFTTPKNLARAAIESDVHLIGVSSQAGSHSVLVPELMKELKSFENDIKVVVGGVIPQEDHKDLFESGIKAIFGPGTPITESLNKVMDILEKSEKS